MLQATTSDGSPRCQALTKSGTQCTRKAEAGSNYCWQHKEYKAVPAFETKQDYDELKVNSELLQKSMQPGILSNIMATAGYSAGLNTLTNTMIKNQLPDVVKSWLKGINVKTPIDTIPESQYPFLIQLYQTRIGDRPRNELIENLFEKGFDRIYFL